MLRLAHRILNCPLNQVLIFTGEENADKPIHPAVSSHLQNEHAAIGKIPIIVASNVAEYYWNHENDVFSLSDFPCASPVFDSVFVEWDAGNLLDRFGTFDVLQAGTRFDWSPAEEWTQDGDLLKNSPAFMDSLKKSRWVIAATSWVFGKNGFLRFYPGFEFLAVGQNGMVLDVVSQRETVGECGSIYQVGLLAISFMHCKNVIRTDATETEGPPAKWLRRMKQPTLRYHVLNINPMKEVLRKEGGSETNGLKKALHICRGHFATYTPDKPLFGHFTGTVWKAAHVRGSKEFGEVRKDYNVNPPKSP